MTRDEMNSSERSAQPGVSHIEPLKTTGCQPYKPREDGVVLHDSAIIAGPCNAIQGLRAASIRRAKKNKLLVVGSLETVWSLTNFSSDAGQPAPPGHRERRLFVPAHLMPELLQQGGFGMRNDFDFAPYRRSTVGFDHLFDLLETGMRGEAPDGYPPFDIARDGEDNYTITLAVAGFRPNEIEIVAQRNQLSVMGKPAEDKEQRAYLHRGISRRAFERRFQLADFIEVGDAQFENGLLSIALRRVIPEAMKPRKIAIVNATEASGGSEAASAKALEAA